MTEQELLAEIDRLQEQARDAAKEAELHRCFIEHMAGERHLLHSSPGKENRFWGCSRAPCKAASEHLRGTRPWYCKALKAGSAGGNYPQDCDWPFCGCDPAANRAIEALEESGASVTFPSCAPPTSTLPAWPGANWRGRIGE